MKILCYRRNLLLLFFAFSMLYPLRCFSSVSGSTPGNSPFQHESGYDFEYNGMCYKIRATNEPEVAAVAAGRYYKGDIVLPDVVKYGGVTYKVTKVDAFYMSADVTSITIPRYVRKICNFYGGRYSHWNSSIVKALKNTSEVTVEPKLKKVIFNAIKCDTAHFATNNQSTMAWNYLQVVFPSTVTTVEIGQEVTVIPTGLFFDCTKIKTLSIPKSVEEIRSSIISDDNIESFTLDCENLRVLGWSPKRGKEVTKITSNFSTLPHGDLTCLGMPPGEYTTLTIPNWVKRLPTDVFIPYKGQNKYYTFDKLILNKELEYVEDEALGHWDSYTYRVDTLVVPTDIRLKSIGKVGLCAYKVILHHSLDDVKINENSNFCVFGRRCNELVVAEGVESIPKGLGITDNNITTLTLPSTIKRIGESAFSGSQIKTVNIPAGIEFIGEYAFNSTKEIIFNGFAGDCDNNYKNIAGEAQRVVLPKNCEYIPAGIAAGCDKLTELVLPENVKRIGNEAFYNCKNLILTVPGTVESIGKDAFNNVKHLTFTRFPENPGESFLSAARYVKTLEFLPGCKKIPNAIGYKNGHVLLSEGIEEIGDDAFVGCEQVNLPTTLKKIGTEAFKSANLGKIIIPKDIESIGERAFMSNSRLVDGKYQYIATTHLVFTKLPKQNTENALAFKGAATGVATVELMPECEYVPCRIVSLDIEDEKKKIILHEGIKSIEDSAFYFGNCLIDINFPSTLKRIGKAAFERVQITEVSLPEGLEEVGDFAFVSTPLSDIQLPQSIKRFGKKAFYGYNPEKIVIPEIVESYNASIGTENLKEVEWNAINCTDGVIFDCYREIDRIVIGTNVKELPSRISHYQKTPKVRVLQFNAKNADWNSDNLYSIESVEFGDEVEELKGMSWNGWDYGMPLAKIRLPSSLKIISTRFLPNFVVEDLSILASEPPTILFEDDWCREDHFFAYTRQKNTTLKVPVGSADAYRNTFGWRLFNNIVEDESLNDASFSSVTQDARYEINGREMTIYSEGLSIYTISGICVHHGVGSVTLQPGIYIIDKHKLCIQ